MGYKSGKSAATILRFLSQGDGFFIRRNYDKIDSMNTNKENIENFLKNKLGLDNFYFLGEGWNSIIYCIDNKVFKFPKEQSARHRQEADLLKFLRPYATVEIPSPELFHDDLDYLVYNKINGRHWSVAEFAELPVASQDRFAGDCARFLYGMHQIDLTDAKNKLGNIEQINHILDQIIAPETLFEILKDYFDSLTFDRVYQKYIECFSQAPDMDIVFLHQDFKGINSFVNDDFRLSGVIDFDLSCPGERHIEFKNLYDVQHPNCLKKILTEYKKLSGISIDPDRVKQITLKSLLGSLPQINAPGMSEMRQKSLESRVRRLKFFI